MKKISKIIMMLIVLIGFLMISIGIFLSLNQNNNKEETKLRQLICMKKETSEDLETVTTFTTDIAEDGTVSEEQIIVVSTYHNTEKYNRYKNLQPNDSIITYDDSKNEITRTFSKSNILDGNQQPTVMKYETYQEGLELEDYQCHVSE